MLWEGKEKFGFFSYLGKTVSIVWIGMKKIYSSIRSCFGNGYWDNDQPWDNDDGWNNG